MRSWSILFTVAALQTTGSVVAAPLDAKAINDAHFTEKKPKGFDPAIIKAQILLDRARFSPGMIDGRNGENFGKAVAAFPRLTGSEQTKG